ncbi:hypothetical protein BDB01DRAFT_851958 [Pilobolus umbonatus]|nr:hypothetical protein BDB01DRAFT_851958 [Pilobolus umbonatus]
MSSIPLAFQHVNRKLVYETRLHTLGLYRALLKSTEQYAQKKVLKSEIRKRFHENKQIVSRSKVLQLLHEGTKLERHLQDPNSLVIQQFIKDTQKTKSPYKKPDTKKKVKITKRKPYQVALSAKHNIGISFKRVRGWVQPVRTSMMIKKRVKVNQKRINKFYEYKSQLEMISHEQEFLAYLGIHENSNDYAVHIKNAMQLSKKYVDPSKTENVIEEERIV